MTIFLMAVIDILLASLYVMASPRRRRVGLYLPDFYIAGIALYAIGAINAVYLEGIVYAQPLVEMALLALGSGLIGATAAAMTLAKRNPTDYFHQILVKENSDPSEKALIRFGLIFSAAVCILFVVMTLRTSAISELLSLSSLFDESSSASRLRKTLTAGTEGYFAPGFVKQFRDILAPIFLIALGVIASKPNARPSSRIYVFGIIGIVLFSMLVAGIRSNIISLFLALYIGGLYSARIKQHHRPVILSWWQRHRSKALLLIAFLLYFLLSNLLGRTASNGSLFSSLFDSLMSLFERIVLTVPRENAQSFNFWSPLGPTNGSLWLDDLKSALPGSRVSGTGLSNILHNINGGSIQGNSPLGLPADVWMAWGWPGLCIIPCIYGVCLGFFDNVLTRVRSAIFFGTKIVLAIALLYIYSPFGFLLYGGAASVILVIVVSFLRSRRSQDAQTRRRFPSRPAHRAFDGNTLNNIQNASKLHD